MNGPGARDKAMERYSSISSVISRSICCQMPRRTLLPPGGNAHPSVELISRDRGTTKACGATRGAPQALQIADRWHVIHNLGEALEKILARYHADLKRALTPEEEHQVTAVLDQQA